MVLFCEFLTSYYSSNYSTVHDEMLTASDSISCSRLIVAHETSNSSPLQALKRMCFGLIELLVRDCSSKGTSGPIGRHCCFLQSWHDRQKLVIMYS